MATAMEKLKISIVNYWEKITKDIPHSKDRRYYLLFWFCFCAAALAYFIYVATKCAQAYKTPGASFSVDPTQPPFPIFALCIETAYLVQGSNFTATAYYNYNFQTTTSAAGLHGVYFDYTSPDDSSNFCAEICSCLQFNSPLNSKHDLISNNTGKVTIFANAAYQKTTPRSVFYLFVRSQAYGAFSNESTDNHFDILNIPTGTYVDASWTVSNHTTITGWVPPSTKTDVSYAMVQQVETLTPQSAKNALQNLASTPAVCTKEGAPCKDPTSEEPGNCLTGPYGLECDFTCTPYYAGYNGSSVPISWRCDGYDDCDPINGTYADEEGCLQFNCTDGQQVSYFVKCDGVNNCDDGSDESLSTCGFFPLLCSATVYPYTKEVSVITETVTYTWDVAFAAFKSVCELGLGVLAFLFPLYFIQKSEPRRFILRPGKTDSDQALEMQTLSEEKVPKSSKASTATQASPQASHEAPSSERTVEAETATES